MADPINTDELLALVQDKQITAIKAIEDEAVRKATESRYAVVDKAIAQATKDWIEEFGSTRGTPEAGQALNRMIGDALRASNSALGGLEESVISALSEAVGSAVTTAAEQGAAFFEAATGAQAATNVAIPAVDLAAEAVAVRAAAAEGVQEAAAILKPSIIERIGLRGILGALRRARNALGRAKATITTSVNENVTKVMRATSVANKAPYELWVTEKDACVRCTKYAGRIVKTGQNFPGGLSWDPKYVEKNADPVRPPLHPHCRCQLVPWNPAWKREGEVSLPEAVQREAERSIARGFSLESESNASRIRALRELLDSNPKLPKTVLARAERDLKAGQFKRGRSVPTSNP